MQGSVGLCWRPLLLHFFYTKNKQYFPFYLYKSSTILKVFSLSNCSLYSIFDQKKIKKHNSLFLKELKPGSLHIVPQPPAVKHLPFFNAYVINIKIVCQLVYVTFFTRFNIYFFIPFLMSHFHKAFMSPPYYQILNSQLILINSSSYFFQYALGLLC